MKRPTVRLLQRVGLRSFRSRQASPTTAECHVDEPAPWSLLRKTILDIFPLDDHEWDALWTSTGEQPVVAAIDLPEGDWQRLAAAAIYKDDPCDVLLAVTLDYLLELQISSEGFDMIVDSVTSLINTNEYSKRLRPEVLANNKRIVADTDIAAIRNFRIDSFIYQKTASRACTPEAYTHGMTWAVVSLERRIRMDAVVEARNITNSP